MNNEILLSVCLGITLFLFVLAITVVFLYRRKVKLALRLLGAIVFTMMWVLIYPSYVLRGYSYAIGLSLLEAMCSMLINSNVATLLGSYEGVSIFFMPIYKSVLLSLTIIAPLFTVGITISFFSERFARIVYRIRSIFSNSYLFSAINERTLSVAEDVVEKNKGALTVFAVKMNEEDIDAESLARIKEIGAFIINDDVVHIKHSTKKKRNYYLLGNDCGENLNLGLDLYSRYNEHSNGNISVWLYTTEQISEVIFDHLYETFNIKLINEEGLIARKLAANHPLYEAIDNGRLSVLVVGGGIIGRDILKTAIMCSSFGENVEVDFHVIDKDAERVKSIFDKECPRMSERWNVTFHKADVGTSLYTEVLKKLNPTYIVVSLPNESVSIDAALYARRIYGLKGGLPLIHTLMEYRDTEKQIFPNLCVSDWSYNRDTGAYQSRLLSSYEIQPFGSYEETYSDLDLMVSYRDCLAVAVNAQHRGVTEVGGKNTPKNMMEQYNQVIFYKNYADTFALTLPDKLYLMGLELVNDGEGDLSLLEKRLDSHIEILLSHEHLRYEAFMRGMGWRDMPPEDVGGKILGDKLTRRNARLDNTNRERLEEITGRDFIKEDKHALYNLPIIIKLANSLFGVSYSVRARKIGTK